MASDKSRPGPASTANQDVLRTSVQRVAGRVPTQEYDEAALLSDLESRYPFGRWLSAKRTEQGYSNHSWFVETEASDVVVRRSSMRKSSHAVQFECALFDHLVASGYPAPPVLRARDGSASVDLDEHQHMTTRRLPGITYKKDDSANLRLAGRALSFFHQVVADLPTDLSARESSAMGDLGTAGPQRLRATMEVMTPLLSGEQRERSQSDAEFLTQQMETIWKELDLVLDDLTYLIVHGSFTTSSLLVVDKQLSGVVDFDRARHDLLNIDLAYAIEHFCRRKDKDAGKVIDQRLYAKFLKHYRAVSPATDVDIESLPLFLRAQRLAKVAKRANSALAKHAVAPRQSKDAASFAEMLRKESARVQWLETNLH